jgi:hypothetical protein
MLSRIFQLLLIACFATSPLSAKTDPFVGRWKLLKLTDQMKVTKAGANRYAFDFGGGVETIIVDGTEQPASAGTTLSVAAEGPNWKVIRKKGSRVLLTATWTLSKDGNSLNDDFTSFSEDGSPSNVKYVYARRAAGLGFAGTWVSTTAALNSVIMLQVRAYDRDGLSFIIPSPGQTLNVKFDGKDYPNAGMGSALSARRLNARSVEIFRKSKSKITQTRQIKLSPDLKTLTMTVHIVGKDEPYIYVFERQ